MYRLTVGRAKSRVFSYLEDALLAYDLTNDKLCSVTIEEGSGDTWRLLAGRGPRRCYIPQPQDRAKAAGGSV